MSTRFLFKIVSLFCLMVFLGQGCLSGNKTPQGPDGGVWKTEDKATTWAQKRALVSGPKVSAAAADFAITTIALDPQDNNAVYAGTVQNGLIYSLDGGNSWQHMANLKVAKVLAIAVDPKHKCVVYVTSRNEIYKTETCGRDWNRVWFDPKTDKTFNQIVIDWFNPTILFAGTSEGDILRSGDAGLTWQITHRLENRAPIISMVIDPRDSRIVYAGTNGDGIWKTTDGGGKWTSIKKQFGDQFSDARRVTQIVIDPKQANTLYVVCKYGILVSADQGETWKAMDLTASPDSIKISALAIDPSNNKNMVYTGPTALAFTADGGQTWSAKKLPTTRGGSAIVIDPKDGGTIYLGTLAPKK